MNGVLVVSKIYHGLNESAPFNMIGAAVKSHFYLIVIRHWSGTPALMRIGKNAALQHLSPSELHDLI
jgi:hypothetical protein